MQEDHDNRVIKVSEGNIQQAYSKLKLELDMWQSNFKEITDENKSNIKMWEHKMLENISLATEQWTKNHKELWESHIHM